MRLPVAVMLLTSATALTSAPASSPVQRLAAEVTGDSFTHTVNAGDTWAALGARYGVEPAVLARRNGRAPGKPLTPGEPIAIDNRHIAWPVESAAGALLVINVPQRMLFRMVDGRVDAFYPVAVGRADWRTPRGPFPVLAKEVDPRTVASVCIPTTWRASSSG